MHYIFSTQRQAVVRHEAIAVRDAREGRPSDDKGAGVPQLCGATLLAGWPRRELPPPPTARFLHGEAALPCRKRDFIS
jgi:hypothetical protein